MEWVVAVGAPRSPERGARYARSLAELSEQVLIIANSQFTRGRLASFGLDPARIEVKYLGVSEADFVLDRPARHEAVLRLLYLGRFVEFKGPIETIRAVAAARELGADVRLTMAGSGDLDQQCRRVAGALGLGDAVRFVGPVGPRKGRELRLQSDVFTMHNQPDSLTGQEEAFGVAIVEAMAAGLPVVTGNSGAVEETVLDGVTGILVSPGDISAHSKALARLALDDELRALLGSAGRARAADCFTTDVERQRLIQLLELASNSS